MVMSTDAVALPLGMRWVIAVGSATGGVAAALATFQFLAHCHHGISQGPSGVTPAAPAKALIFRAIKLHDRHIALPTAIASRENQSYEGTVNSTPPEMKSGRAVIQCCF